MQIAESITHRDGDIASGITPGNESSAEPERDENWCNAPIRSRLAAAYQLGRYLNRLDWHCQHLLFSGARSDKVIVDQDFGRTKGLSQSFVTELRSPLTETIDDIRREWPRWLCCEAAANEAAECYDDRWESFEEFPSRERRRELVTVRVRRPLLDKLRNTFAGVLNETEMWALELGSCVDRGIRRSDISDFFEHVVTLREPTELEDAAARNMGMAWQLIEERCMPRFAPGELEFDPAWPYTVTALLEKLGVPASDTDVQSWTGDPKPHDQRFRLGMIERVDQSIREHLAACDDGSDGSEHSNPTERGGTVALSAGDQLSSVKNVKKSNRKGKHINERMIEILQKVVESKGWSARQWAERLECAKSTVVGTNTWKGLKSVKAALKSERLDLMRKKSDIPGHRNLDNARDPNNSW